MPTAKSYRLERMERELRTRQLDVKRRCELLDHLIGQLTEFVVVLLDIEGCFLTWHPGVSSIFGYSEEEFLGKHLDILYPATERMRGIVERELETVASEGRASDTRWLVRKSGERVYVDGLTIALRDEQGHLIGFGKAIHDVTNRRTTEEALLRLTRSLGQSTVIVRQWDGKIDHWTEGCERLYGWTKLEALGKTVQTLLRTEFEGPRDSIQQQLMASGEWKGEVEQTARSGHKLQVMMNWVLVSGQSTDLPSVIETHTDITDLIEMQREVDRAKQRLEHLTAELERSNRELEDFARIASHDLCSPIISTRWLIDLTLSRCKDRLEGGGYESLQQASANLERMSELVEAILTHARVGRDAIRSERLVACETALNIALANLELDIRRAGAEITRESLPEVHVRPEPLAQLFQNLVSNAIKYRRPDALPQLHIKAEVAPNGWRLSFRDNGIGIAPEFHKRVFQPMQRLHGHEIAGSGIGLATCKKIVERAGGNIWVQSEERAGATFYIELP
jgi:PAS domain S-box-containing protein